MVLCERFSETMAAVSMRNIHTHSAANVDLSRCLGGLKVLFLLLQELTVVSVVFLNVWGFSARRFTTVVWVASPVC